MDSHSMATLGSVRRTSSFVAAPAVFSHFHQMPHRLQSTYANGTMSNLKSAGRSPIFSGLDLGLSFRTQR